MRKLLLRNMGRIKEQYNAYMRQYMKNYRIKHRKEILEQHKNWRKRNPEKHKASYINWRKANRERFLECNRKNRKKWYEKNKQYVRFKERLYNKTPRRRIDRNISTIIRKNLKYKKSVSWKKSLGYTLGNLIEHLEKQFDDKMNWNNYGTYWHLDHKIPKSWFKYEKDTDESFKKCWSLENLQPLEAKENLKKSNKFSS